MKDALLGNDRADQNGDEGDDRYRLPLLSRFLSVPTSDIAT
jgi:hypothetical protein